MASLAPAYITPPQDPAYVAVPKAAHAKFRAPRKRAAKPKKDDQPEAGGLNLQQREDEARAWAAAHGVSAPASFASAARLYKEALADKKSLRVFLAMALIDEDALCMSDKDKHALLLDLKNGLLLAGVPRVSDDNATLMLAFSQRLGIDKDSLKLRK